MTSWAIISPIRMPETTTHSIGERLRAARTARDRSLGDIAALIGVSVATLSRIETGRQSVDLPLFLELARVLAVSPASLLKESDDEARSEQLIEELAALPAAERSRIFSAANERSRGRRITVASLPTRVDALLQSLNAVRSELLDVRGVLRRKR